jgi:YegS/Rv2252/BmrU family lipid kinase
VELARQAVASGCRLIVAVGGDGTMHEVVNGMVTEAEIPDGVMLGAVSCGTGSDFARTVGLLQEPLDAARRLLHGEDRRVDLGVIHCWRAGEEVVEYFPNAAGLGFDGEVALRVNQRSKAGGGTIPYLISLVLTLVTYENKPVVVTLDDRTLTLRSNFVTVANGRYFGGGMHIAPDARPDDGLFDVVIAGDVTKLELLLQVPRVYRGTHLAHPKVDVYRSSTVRVESDERVVLQADGEYVGEAPATFRLLPGALTVRT